MKLELTKAVGQENTSSGKSGKTLKDVGKALYEAKMPWANIPIVNSFLESRSFSERDKVIRDDFDVFKKLHAGEITREEYLKSPEHAAFERDSVQLVLGTLGSAPKNVPAKATSAVDNLKSIFIKAKEKPTAPPGVAGNINLGKYPPKISDAAKAVEIPKQQKITNPETFATAQGLKGTDIVDVIVGKPKGRLSAEMYAQRQNFADAVHNIDDSAESLRAALSAGKKLSKGTAEIGRTLQQQKMPVIEGRIILSSIDKRIRQTTKDVALRNQLIELRDLVEKQVVGKKNIPGFWDQVVEGATAFKLTSPFTHFRNIIGNTYTALMAPLEKISAGAIDAANPIRMFRKQPRTRFMGEGAADVVGRAMGIRSGARNAIKALLDDNFSSSQQRIGEAIPQGGAIPGIVGKVIRTPFRLLSAMDSLFRGMGDSANSYSLAYRWAASKGYKGYGLARETSRNGERLINAVKAARTRGIETAGKPFQLEGISKTQQVMKLTNEQLYQAELDKGFSALNNARNEFPQSKLILPFLKTPVNVTKYYMHRSPLGILSKRNWEDLTASSGSAAEATSRIAIGSAISATLVGYAMQNLITGSLSTYSKSERDLLAEKGILPYQIMIPGINKAVSYRGFEPVASYLSSAADYVEQSRAKKVPVEERASKLLFSVAKNITSQPYLMGLNDLMDAMDSPEQYGERFLGKLISGTVGPVGLGYAQTAISPDIKVQEGLLGPLKAKIPGMAKDLPTRVDVLGKEKKRSANAWERLFNVNELKLNDPLVNELVRLGVDIPFPSRYRLEFIENNASDKDLPKKVKKALLEKHSVKLGINEYQGNLRQRGEVLVKILLPLVKSPQYNKWEDRTKKVILQTFVDKTLSDFNRAKRLTEGGK